MYVDTHFSCKFSFSFLNLKLLLCPIQNYPIADICLLKSHPVNCLQWYGILQLFFPLFSKAIIFYVTHHCYLVNAAEPWDLIGLPNGNKIKYNEIFKIYAALFIQVHWSSKSVVPKQYTIHISVQKLHKILVQLLRKEMGFQYRLSLEICLW